MRKLTVFVLILASMVLLGGCGKFEDIAVHGVKDVKFRGMKDGKILLSLTLDVENPNNRKITISKIYFIAWMNNRELGKIKNSERIVLKPSTREEYPIQIEIVLRTAADVFKLMNVKEDIIEKLTVEGYIKGRTMCFSKKLKIEKQLFSKLADSFKGKKFRKETLQIKDNLEVKDTLETKKIIFQNDTLKTE